MSLLPIPDFHALEQKPWGLLVAYGLLALSVYLFIWAMIEPANIPDQLLPGQHLPASRVFYHLIATSWFTGHVLLIGIFIRWRPKIRAASEPDLASESRIAHYTQEIRVRQRELDEARGRISDLEKRLEQQQAAPPELSKLDRKILGLLAGGQALSTDEIADKLGLVTSLDRDQLYLSLETLCSGQRVVPDGGKVRRAP
jgi:hypothetical protein